MLIMCFYYMQVYIQVFIVHYLLESVLKGELSGAHGFDSGDQGNQTFLQQWLVLHHQKSIPEKQRFLLRRRHTFIHLQTCLYTVT